MAFARTKKIGQSPGDPNQLDWIAINGRAIALGDADDTLGTFTTGERQDSASMIMGVGMTNGTDIDGWRLLPLVLIPVVDIIPAFSRVLRATVAMQVKGAKFPSNIVPNGQVTLNYYGMRRAYDKSTINFQVWKTGSNWGAFGTQIGVDTTQNPVGSFVFNQSDFGSLTPFGSQAFIYKIADIRDEAQYRIDRNEQILLIGHLAGWGFASQTNGQAKQLTFGNMTTTGTAQPYFEIFYVPPIVLHSSLSTSGRKIDLANVLDAESADSRQHIYMGFVDQGETGDPMKYWVRNTRTDRVSRRLIIECTRSFAGTPTRNAANSSAKILRSADTFNLALNGSNQITQLTPRGDWQIEAISGTQYKISFKANMTGSFVQKATNLNFANDNTIIDTSVTPNRDLVRIRTAKWGAGSVATGDKWDFQTVADTTKPEYPTDSKGMMRLIPPTTPQGDTPDTDLERPLSGGPTQKLRASTYVHNDSGTDRTVAMVGDTQLAGYQVGQKCYIFDGVGFEAVTIKQIFLTGDALPATAPGGESGDGILLEEELSRTYAAGAFFTPGLYIELLDKSQDAFVATGGAAAGQNLIDLTLAQTWDAPDTITVVNFTTGETATYIIQDALNGGLRMQLTTNLSFALGAGDMVIKDITTNQASFFARGIVPDGATLGDRLALLRVYEARTSLINVQ